jgi:hypothetical protein
MVPLCVLPSALWRVSLLADDAITLDAEGWYLIALSGASVGLALLTPALVHRWSERFPRWAVVVPAVTGALLLIAISLYAVVNATFHIVGQGPVLIGPDTAPRPEPDGWVALVYLPLLAWGPLVLAVALDHGRRRRTG